MSKISSLSQGNFLNYFAVIFILLSAALGFFVSVTVNEPPVIYFNQSQNAPLTGILEVKTHKPRKIKVEVSDGVTTWDVPVKTTSQMSHSIPILGLKPDTKHTIRVQAAGVIRNIVSPSAFLELTTAPLPDDFPPLDVRISKPDKMEAGMTLFNVYRWPGQPDNSYGLILGVNEQGEIVWYYRANHRLNDVALTSEGNILYTKARHNHSIVEIDIMGNVLNEWHPDNINKKVPQGATPVATDQFHHHVQELPSGNILSMSTELREYDNYYTSEKDIDAPREKAHVVGDVILEFKRDGTIVHEWKLLDILDPYRIGYGSLGAFFNTYFGVLGEASKDWSHGNAAEYVEKDDSILVSLRTQDAVVKIGRTDGELKWILGNHEGWGEKWQPYLLDPVGDNFQWPYHQHAPEYTKKGTIVMFDNGNFRKMPFEEKEIEKPEYSRVVEYEVDEENMTIRQVWAYGGKGQEQFFSGAIADADPMPQTGNLLVTDGFREIDGVKAARIVEVTNTTPAEKVFELYLYDGESQWHVYRAERIKSLYNRTLQEN